MEKEINYNDWMTVNEPEMVYKPEQYPHADLTYRIINACFEVHNTLGKGFSEIVYKDALEYELNEREISSEREKKFEVPYKGIVLKHAFFADFVIEEKVILEVKAQEGLIQEFQSQILNYLAASGCKVGLLVNFGERSLKFKRLVL